MQGAEFGTRLRPAPVLKAVALMREARLTLLRASPICRAIALYSLPVNQTPTADLANALHAKQPSPPHAAHDDCAEYGWSIVDGDSTPIWSELHIDSQTTRH